MEVRSGNVYVIDGEGERVLPQVSSKTELFEEFIMEIQGKGTCRISAEDAFFATRTALCARLSEDTGRTVAIEKGIGEVIRTERRNR